MENKIQELTDKLYHEGVEKGKAEAERLIAAAKEQAAELIAKAQEEAADIVAKAKKNRTAELAIHHLKANDK